jgi:hypothetical protein
MKKKFFFTLVIVLTIFILIYLIFFRRTAYSVGSQEIGFDLPKSIKLDTFIDEWDYNPSGDGEVIIIFSLNEDHEKFLQTNCLNADFKKLPITENLPDNYVYTLISREDTLGYYKCEIDDSDNNSYSFTILDLKNHKLYIYYILM